MSERITRELTRDALEMALVRRRPLHGLLHHSDRGSQYASGDYQTVLATEGIACSMTGVAIAGTTRWPKVSSPR